jgi:hypothetical protein
MPLQRGERDKIPAHMEQALAKWVPQRIQRLRDVRSVRQKPRTPLSRRKGGSAIQPLG